MFISRLHIEWGVSIGWTELVILLLKIILFTKWSPKFTKVWYWASHFEQVWHATLLMAKSVTLEIMFSEGVALEINLF